MKRFFVLIVCIVFLGGCASYSDYIKAYGDYSKATSTAYVAKMTMRQNKSISGDAIIGNEVCRIKFTKGVAVAGLEEIVCSIPDGLLTKSDENEKAMILPPQAAPDVLGNAISKVVDVGSSVIPWYLSGKELSDVLKSAIKNTGHNVSGSYNIPTEYNYTDSYNGDYRDFTGDIDNHVDSHDINNSYNPSDRHDIYNPIDSHDTKGN